MIDNNVSKLKKIDNIIWPCMVLTWFALLALFIRDTVSDNNGIIAFSQKYQILFTTLIWVIGYFFKSVIEIRKKIEILEIDSSWSNLSMIELMYYPIGLMVFTGFFFQLVDTIDEAWNNESWFLNWWIRGLIFAAVYLVLFLFLFFRYNPKNIHKNNQKTDNNITYNYYYEKRVNETYELTKKNSDT